MSAVVAGHMSCAIATAFAFKREYLQRYDDDESCGNVTNVRVLRGESIHRRHQSGNLGSDPRRSDAAGNWVTVRGLDCDAIRESA